jgi:LAO/AO transport system kinase
VGVTGPPGAGKSTLVDRLTTALRQNPPEEFRRPAGGGAPHVGVIAIDPTSPYSGGAVLGDRLRMSGHAGDASVFIRSMATRGSLGGLSRATGDAVLVLDAAGYDVVIIETVGVGQDEVDIVGTADVSIVTLVPGAGDDVQALKAGVMEIADIFVVNKADREGADRLVSVVEATLALAPDREGRWCPPVLKAVATTGAGVSEVLDAVVAFRRHQQTAGDASVIPSSREARRRARAERRVRDLIAHGFADHLDRRVLAPGELEAIVERIASRTLDPYTAADQVLTRALGTPRVAGGGRS